MSQRLWLSWNQMPANSGGKTASRISSVRRRNRIGCIVAVAAAMMAKLTGHVWGFAELFETIMPAKVAA
jgi:hypothetical protein